VHGTSFGADADDVNSQSAPDQDERVFAAVSQYIQLGLKVLPFKRGTGVCYLDGDEASDFTCADDPVEIAEKFSGYDVGIDVAASGLVDLDIDCVEAVPFIEEFLLPTRTIRRASKQCSHQLFHHKVPITGKHFKDLDGKEVLAVLPNVRLALPPSYHSKSGERLAWVKADSCFAFVSATLPAIAGRICAFALVTRLWPTPGARHDAGLSLAGALVRRAFVLEQTQRILQLIAVFWNDPNLHDRLEEARSTYERFAKKEANISGLPTLAKLLAPQRAKQLESLLSNYLGAAVHGEDGAHENDLTQFVRTWSELNSLHFPEAAYLVEPFLAKSSLSMLFAVRGVGKTWLGLFLALCLTRGEDFLCWAVPKPRKVLLVDGEMPVERLQFRLRALSGGEAISDSLRVISVAEMWQHDQSLTINEETDQERIEKMLAALEAQDAQPDLIIFDNLSSLMAGVDENSNSELDTFLRWLIKLRARGYAVLLVHHAGKAGTQRGASRREDLLDTVIELKAKDRLPGQPSSGACFEIQFSKLRGNRPKPDRLCVALTQTGSGRVEWTVEEGQDIPAYLRVLREIHRGKHETQKSIADALGISKQAVSEHIKTARAKGYLKKETLELTPAGVTEVKKVFAGEEGYESIF